MWAGNLLGRLGTLSPAGLADALEAHDARRRRSAATRGAPGFPAPPPAAAERGAEPRLELGQLRRAARWFETLARVYGVAVDLCLRRSVAREPDSASEPVDREVVHLLARFERLLAKYPVAAQAAFSALVAEGRAFARTEEGARYDAALRASRALSKPWLIFERASSRLLLDREGLVLPSTYIDAFFQGAELRSLAPLFARMFGREEP